MLNRLQAVFASFHARDCKYVVLGGIAAVLYGVPRATFDLDILIEASPDNARRLLDALIEARMHTAALVSPEELLGHETQFSTTVSVWTCKPPRRDWTSSRRGDGE